MKTSTETCAAASREHAFGEAKAAERRLKCGRVILTIEKFDGVVIYHRVETEYLTERDLDRLMRERPQPAGKGEAEGRPS